jgi:hypothetical protein
VKGGKAKLVEQAQLDACEVTVGKERLGMACDQLEIETIEQVVGAIAASQAQDGAGVFIGECGVQIGEALLSGSGKVERAVGLRGSTNAGGEVENAQGLEAALKSIRLGKGGGGDDANT